MGRSGATGTKDAMSDDNPTELVENNDSPAYKRVTAEQAAEMAHIRRVNPKATYAEIAAAVGVASVSTVSYWITRFERDTVQDARKVAKSEALRSTLKLSEQVEHADPRVSQGAAKALVALAGVQEGAQQVSVGVQVIVGSSAHPAGPDPFEAITATVVESKS